VLQLFSAAVEDRAVADVEREGRRISCGPGCGACCRQLVPVTPIEARRLAELVARLPEPRRSQVRARFADAVGRLDAAGILERLRHPETMSDAERSSLGMDYFQLRIPCPFLVDESCSIHPDRPLVCREYLVTSPAANCANPTEDNIAGVSMPVRLSKVLARFADQFEAHATKWVPLALAPEWALAHPDQSPLRAGSEWVTMLLRSLTEGELPGAHDGDGNA
jgi:Fe-S-cluster containining protein